MNKARRIIFCVNLCKTIPIKQKVFIIIIAGVADQNINVLIMMCNAMLLYSILCCAMHAKLCKAMLRYRIFHYLIFSYFIRLNYARLCYVMRYFIITHYAMWWYIMLCHIC